ncbi:hypothetical protein ABZ780_25675 [Micromonospora sp. NPDC047467]|uniref:hypothetical protein n=1 Tax=Micromonospora sp. NPDC047467 TaxID=3154814 RepID=UPI0033F951FB
MALLTFNTVTKCALAISDTLALGVCNDSFGAGLPIVAVPHVKRSWPHIQRTPVIERCYATLACHR